MLDDTDHLHESGHLSDSCQNRFLVHILYEDNFSPILMSPNSYLKPKDDRFPALIFRLVIYYLGTYLLRLRHV
jgi:hypothetical protein